MSYQTHGDESGISDSQHKLERIRLPEAMAGMSMLDLGCNEGFFCHVASERGATRVVGLDVDPRFLLAARTRYGGEGVEFLERSWHALPDEQFDVILWLSAMHYERDPVSVFRAVSERLRPGGLFILECGVVEAAQPSMLPIPRHSDVPYYPTARFIETELSRIFALREVGVAETTPGDSVPRYVFHCRKLATTVILIRGTSGVGKSALRRALAASATKVISVDKMIGMLATRGTHESPLLSWLRSEFDRDNLEPVMSLIDAGGHTDEFVRFIAGAVVPSDTCVLIDGALTDHQAEYLKNVLKDSAFVWEATRTDSDGLIGEH